MNDSTPDPMPVAGVLEPPPGLSPKELGFRFGRSRRTIYRWMSDGLIPQRFVTYAGPREVRISAEAVEHLNESFRGMHRSPAARNDPSSPHFDATSQCPKKAE